MWQFAIDYRRNKYGGHGKANNEITPLNAPHMIHIKGCIGDKEDQINDRNVAQNNKTGKYRDPRSTRSVQLQFLQRYQHEKDREHEISPGGKQNILPAQNANELAQFGCDSRPANTIA